MSTWSTMPTDCLTALRLAVEEHAGEGTPIRTTALSLCIEAVAFAREGRPREVGLRARTAAALLLDLTCPELDPRAVEALAAACERAAVSRR
jgi:hypothetical protein